jgi:leucyl aminopeptidase
MPCFYSVARGSLASDPPKFIHLHYKGTNAIRKVALVGKSVIFDTGGYQVKPGNSMVTMKGDMAGGASVLGAFKALLALKPEHLEINVYLAATPNKIDSDAFIPDSILDTTCGKKVEMRHTDAEGRLTLIDAVTKAELEKPDVIITVATLTGAAMRAVGRCIALMGNNTAWRNKLEAAARTVDEPLQVLDLLPEDFENISSKLDGADIRNTSKSDNRGAQSAAAFILAGVKEQQPLLHLDIAGADMWQNETASALSVRTLATFLLQLV